jgi:hypothetical protein
MTMEKKYFSLSLIPIISKYTNKIHGQAKGVSPFHAFNPITDVGGGYI